MTIKYACPIRGHEHSRVLYADGSLRCPRDAHRWIPVETGSGLAEALKTAPKVILRTLRPEHVEGLGTFVLRRRPHWGWPRGWAPGEL